MRKYLGMLCVAAAACGKTEPGPIGSVELRHYLPEQLRTSNPGTHDSTYRATIRVGPDSAPVEMAWTVFQHDSGRFLGSIAARLEKRVPYDSLVLGGVSRLDNRGTKWAALESGNIDIVWYKKRLLWTRGGKTTFLFTAGGKGVAGIREGQ